ncbi:MAG: helix-turn-helix domain-containing protein [Planctomycetia bacterium]|jgi:AraC-like DNA-binding protein
MTRPPRATSAEFAAEQVLALFDALPDVQLFVKDRESRFVKVNAAWLTNHGVASEAEAVGTTDYDYHPPALAAQYVAEDQRVMRSGKPLRDQPWLVADHTGMPQWYLCTKLPLFDGSGRVSGIAGILQPFGHAGHAPDEYRRLNPALEYVVANYRRSLTVGDVARRADLSASQLQREFRRLFGMTVGDYILRLRLLMARRRLRATTDAVGRIATDCGFYDQAHFTRAFKKHTGQTPIEYRRDGR